jgi:MFS family permease
MSDPTPKQAYETPDDDRAASAAPTEPQLEREMPGGREVAGHDPYAALRHRRYVIYMIAFFISVIASQMETFTATYEIFKKTGSTMSLGLVGLVLGIPMLLLTLPAGHLADSRSRRRMIVVTQSFCAVCLVGLSMLSHYGHAWPHSIGAMYLLLSLSAAGATIGRPARAALMPQLVPQAVFSNAVTWNSSTFETATVLGPTIAGFICAKSIPSAYFVSAIGFAICAVLMATLPETHDASAKRRSATLSDVSVGLRFVWRAKLMLGAMTMDLFAVLLGGAVFLLPAVATDILHVGPIALAWLRAGPSIGAISMALILAHRPPMRRAGRALLLSVAGFGVATVIFGLSRNFWLSFVMLILTGAFDNISVVVRHTIVQMLTPDEMRGRVSAVNQIFIGSSNEIGGFESGVTAAWLGTVRSIVFGGIGTLLVVTVCSLVFPAVRTLGSLQDIKPAARPTESENPSPAPTTT